MHTFGEGLSARPQRFSRPSAPGLLGNDFEHGYEHGRVCRVKSEPVGA